MSVIGNLLTDLISQMTTLNVNIDAMRQDQSQIMQAITHTQSGVHADRARSRDHRDDTRNRDASNIGAIPNSNEVQAMIDSKHVPLPVGGSITEKAQKSALNGQFTNLAEFIPCNNVPESSDMETVVTQSGSLYVRPRKPLKVVDSFATWLTAWSNYEALIISHRPELYNNFVQYRIFIQSCDKKYLWHSVYGWVRLSLQGLKGESQVVGFS